MLNQIRNVRFEQIRNVRFPDTFYYSLFPNFFLSQTQNIQFFNSINELKEVFSNPEIYKKNTEKYTSQFKNLSEDMVTVVAGTTLFGQGIDCYLKNLAIAQKKEIYGLDTVQGVKEGNDCLFPFYFSQSTQDKLINGYLTGRGFAKEVRDVRTYLDWWKKGDVEAEICAEGLVESWMNKNKEFARNHSNRNQDMFENSKKFMQNLKPTKKRLFIAVGAAHLSGEDGIISAFEKSNLKVVRVK